MKIIQATKPKKSNKKKTEKPQNGGEAVERDENGRFVNGHIKLGGKKKGTFSLLTILKKQLQQIPKELKGKERKQYADLLIKKVLHKAIVEGDDATIRLIFNYIEGMPKQDLNLGNKDGEAFTTKVIILPERNEKTNLVAGQPGAADNSPSSIAQ